MFKKGIFVLLLALGISAPSLVAHAATYAGFIPNPIWFSSEELKAGTTTKIYTLVHNGSADALSMTVTFYDGDLVLGKKTAIVSAGSAKDFSVDWKVIVGDHAVRAHIEDPRKGSATGQSVSVSSTDTDTYRFTVLADLSVHPFEKATPPPATTTTPTSPPSSTSKSSFGEKKDSLINGAQTTFDKFDAFRVATAEEIKKSITKTEKEFNEAGTAETVASSTPSTAHRPLAYVKLFFLKMFYFIFSKAALLYGLIALIIILFVRYLIRAPR